MGARAWLITAIVVSAALVLGAPFIGQLRSALRSAVGESFAGLMATAVGALVAVALGYAVSRVRERRGSRLGALAASFLIVLGYVLLARTGNPEVDAVESFHFVEYGLITALFYRAFRPASDGAVLAMPILAALLVGTLEEWLQWFIPARVGEARDVLLNGFAIASGLLFSVGVAPPPRLALTVGPRSRAAVGWLGAAALLVFAAFFHCVHLGHEIKDAEAGVFKSRYAPDELLAHAVDRARAWRTSPPLTWSRLSREDQYLSEGVAHVQRRNETWQEGNVLAARHENLILERYYAPVLDSPSFLSPTGHRWPDAQRADAESRVGPGFMIYVSDALDSPIMIWPKWAFWTVVAGLTVLILRAAHGSA